MNTKNIAVVLKSRGITSYTRFTDAGIEIGIPMPDGQMLCSIVPIDDESDMRFCDFVEAKTKEYKKQLLDLMEGQ